MGNAVALFKKYISLLDEVYKNASKSAVLDSNAANIASGAGANEFIVPKISMQGLADYSRNSGYVSGDVTLTNETIKANFDRGRSFTIDAMDNEETAGVAFGRLSSEFIRVKVVPEIDAFRFAVYAGKAGNSAKGVLATGEDAIKAITAAMSKMDDDEVPEESRILFVTPTIKRLIEAMDTTKSREIIANFGNRLVTVPQSRFYTAIDQLDGSSSGETAGGYVKHAATTEPVTAAGQNINFMIVEKSAVIQFEKHVVPSVFSPEENQSADGWKFNYRNYALCDVYENKTAGIYLHSVA